MRHARGIHLALLALVAFGCRTRHGRDEEPVAKPDQPRPEEKKTTPQEPTPAKPREQFTNKRFLEFEINPEKTAGRKGVELWYSTDDINWTNHGFYEAGLEAAKFLAPRDGKYRVAIVPVDKRDQRLYTPPHEPGPDFVVTVDTIPPVVQVKTPNGGEIFGADRWTMVTWIAEDANMAPNGIRIEFSTGGDRWLTIARDKANTGSFHWNIPPGTSSENCRIRVVATDLAGNEGTGTTDGTFIVDGLPPDVRLVGPTLSMDRPAKIEYRGGDVGGAGLERLSLYITRDRGQTWTFYKDFDPAKPILFEELDGIYGLYLVGVDKVGNANRAPVAGAKPQMTLILDTTKPVVKVLAPTAGAYLGGRAIDVQWSAKDNIEMAANGITLYYSNDNGKTWRLIDKDLKPDGEYKWTTPKVPGDQYLVKAVGRDLVGNEAEALSDRFAIDMAPPEARVTGPATSNKNLVPVTYGIQAPGFGKISKVTLYYSPDDGRNWFKYEEFFNPDVTKPITFSHADGKYGLYATCVSDAGERAGASQAAPTAGTTPQLTVEIDATPPALTLETLAKGGYVRAGSVYEIRWTHRDAHPDPAGMTILYSPDRGTTWSEIASKIDPTLGKYAWAVPKERGGEHFIRLICTDTFGNRTQVESERAFFLDDDLPVVWIDKPPARFVRSRQITAEYRSKDEISGVARVELWYKPMDQRAKYKKLNESVNPNGSISGEIKEDGTYGFLVVAVDGVGHLSTDPDTDPRPDFIASLDVTPPSITLFSHKGPDNTTVLWLNDNFELTWTASDNISAPDTLTVRVDASSDAGKTWVALTSKSANTGRYDVRNDLLPGKRYRMRVTVFDESGNEATAETTEFSIDDLPVPSLIFRGIQPGQNLGDGTEVTLYWKASVADIKEVAMEMQKGNSGVWLPMGRYTSQHIRFTAPKEHGVYSLRLVGVDGAQRKITSGFLTFQSVDISLVIVIRITANREVTAGGLQSVAIVPRGVHKLVKRAVLQIWENNRWRDVKEVTADGLTFPAPERPGEYALRVLAMPKEGKDFQSNEYMFTVKKPKDGLTGVPPIEGGITLDTFGGGGVYRARAQLIIAFKTDAALDQIRVLFSTTGGQSWATVPKSDLTTANDKLFWKLPDITSKTCRIRLVTESGLHGESGADFAIDGKAPATRLTGPKGAVTAPVKLTFSDVLSIAPIKSRTLYMTRDGGKTWTVAQEFAGDKVLFSPTESGAYGLYLTATSSVGLKSPAPVGSTPPSITVDVTAGGGIALETFGGGGIYRAGDQLLIAFKTDAALDQVRVMFSATGGRSWETVPKSDLTPASGGMLWKLPDITSKTCRLRLITEGGLHGESGADFAIDGNAPATRLTGPKGAVTAPVKLTFSDVLSIAPIKSRTLYMTRDAGKTWTVAQEFEGDNVLFSPKESGTYGLYLTATSSVGLKSPAPVDSTPPSITVDVTVGGPGGMAVTWKPERANLKADTRVKLTWQVTSGDAAAKVTLHLAVKGGDVQTIKSGLPLSGELEWVVPKVDCEEAEIRLSVDSGDGTVVWGRPSSAFGIDSTPPGVKTPGEIER